MTKFKVGDVVNSSLTSPQVIEEIRVGVDADFINRHIDHSGQLCYVLRYIDGKKLAFVYSCVCIDSDHHLKGSEMYELYQEARKVPLTFI